MSKESSPESKFDAFVKTVGNTPKPETPEEKAVRRIKEAREFREKIREQILNRKSI